MGEERLIGTFYYDKVALIIDYMLDVNSRILSTNHPGPM